MQANIDILIPVYNHAEHLARCLESAVNQTMPARKIICVDDASPDPQVKVILNEFAVRCDYIHIINLPENKGICAAQNEGVRSASADFIAFLDCDDWLESDALERVAISMASERAGYFFTDRVDVNEVTGIQATRVYGGQPHLRQKRSHAENLLDHMVASHFKVIRRDLIEEIGGFTEGTDGVQDWDVALKISELAPLFHLSEPLYFHRVHDGQNSSYDSIVNIRKLIMFDVARNFVGSEGSVIKRAAAPA